MVGTAIRTAAAATNVSNEQRNKNGAENNRRDTCDKDATLGHRNDRRRKKKMQEKVRMPLRVQAKARENDAVL